MTIATSCPLQVEKLFRLVWERAGDLYGKELVTCKHNESVWIHGFCSFMAGKNPARVEEELIGKGVLQPLLLGSTRLKYGVSSVGRETKKTNAKETHHNSIQKEEEEEKGLLTFSSQEHTAIVAQLKACAKQKDLSKGSKLHAAIVESKLLEKNIFIGSTLVYMYAKCGALAKAHQVFEELPLRNVFSWTALITGYAQHGLGEEALDCFEQMKCEGLSPDAITFACILKACGGIKSGQKGKKLHAEILREGLLGTSTVLGNALVDMYVKCSALAKAQQVFDELPGRDVVCWNALITGYSQHGQGEKSLACFRQMKLEGLSPNAVTFLCVLKACGSLGALEKGREIHDEIVDKGLLGKDSVLRTALVDMYAKCGVLGKAQQVFDELPVHDVVSWNTLITGYCQQGLSEEALNCFEKMKHEDLSPDSVTYACILKACGNIGAIARGIQIHDEILRKGLLRKDSVLGTSLVDMYVKCGALTKAQKVFDELSAQDVVSWNALIAGYSQHGYGEEAFNCLERMKRKGVSPNVRTFSSILNACGSMGASEKGSEIHAEIIRDGLQGKVSELGNALVDMYAKCGALVKAQEVFDNLLVQDVVSWTTLIAGYYEHGHGKEAITCFEQMLQEGLSPDSVTFACILKACGSIGAVEKGQIYYDSMTTTYGIVPTLDHHIYMVDLWGGAGHFDKAMAVINKMPSSDFFVLWYALLGACQKWGNVKLGKLAFEHAVQLNDKSAAVYVCMSKIYAAAGMQEDAAKMLAKAKEVFESLPVRDIGSWNALITGFCQHGHDEEALDCFEWTKCEGLCPNALTFLCTLKACGSIGAAEKGKEMHDEIIRKGLLEKDSVLGTALVDMYAKCGALGKAQEVFDKLLVRNVVSWNALIAGYFEHGHGEEALNCYELMKCEGISPDAVTLICMLKACGSLGAAHKGKEIHDMVICERLLEKDSAIGTALIDMYSKCGALAKAQEVFDELSLRDVVSWNALITGYCQHGHGEEALDCFGYMKREGVAPNTITFASILKACGSIGAVEIGKEIHAEIAREGLQGNTSVLGTALVDMYAKCNTLAKAQEVLDRLSVRDVFTWTALITGYCQHGRTEEALNCFEQMKLEGASPDAVTFVCILKVCSSIGAAEKGQMYYEAMSTSYGITPTVEHHTCMVKIFGCAGQFDKVMALMKKMPSFDSHPAWFSLMDACKNLGNVRLGHLAFEHAVRSDEKLLSQCAHE